MAKTTHREQITRLKRIEGQIRGVQKMIENERYCIDILHQLQAIEAAVKGVEANILKGKRKGKWIGRVTIRQVPRFMLSTKKGKIDGVHPKYMRVLYHGDGYEYSYTAPKKKAK